MIYWLFPKLNPLLPTFLLCPILAILIGVCFAYFKGNIYLGLILALLLPLIFIATNLETIAVNIDAWILYGFIYAIITFVAYKMAFSQLGKSS
ncbi:hypothetical protein ACFQ5D_23345 [Paenibacillus farraposensis]|uniref:DUF2651 domain-containing protein n=1 Tax=Paenibacillus farraposensis TaxID=2807095 RepID=A0ABW4DHN0_9BACL|nr:MULTISPECIES: hypothetical protein [Paenibacillus]AJE50311.1 hypothetical protein RE92_04205 [Paenibacillus polymyxa]MCC3381635.1 hypothetical protein [Paenibacillus farraposensis]QOH61308.1 hypothetical protein DI243_07755 [Paenibacillus polymyxa]